MSCLQTPVGAASAKCRPVPLPSPRDPADCTRRGLLAAAAAAVALVIVPATGCAAGSNRHVLPGTDGGARDGGQLDGSSLDGARADGPVDGAARPLDGAVTDGGASDGAVIDAAAGDGGTMTDGGSTAVVPPVLDGIIAPGEWMGAFSARNTVASDWGVAQNELLAVHARAVGAELFVAVEGHIEAGAGNAIVLFVDVGYGDGVGVADLFTLSDGDGALDDAISVGISTPAAFRADFAWGTKDMERSPPGRDARMGWREIAADAADFAWLEVPTVCSRNVCETRIPLSMLGVTTADGVALFGRVVNATGSDVANQCVPMDEPTMPERVAELLRLAPP